MANANKPMGLSPHSYMNGVKWNGGGTIYSILQADTNAYAIGDPVTLAGTADAAGIPNVVLSTAGAGNAITGVIVGLGANIYGGIAGSTAQFNSVVIPATKPANTNYYVLVCDDPNVLFEVQEGGVGTALAAADLGTNINLLSGTNNGYVSGWQIDNNSKGTGATLQCQLLRLTQRADNTFGQYADWLVRINNHSFKAGTAGV